MWTKDKVHKGYNCAYQIHYHIVFPVKYRKALLDEGVVKIIQEMAQAIQEHYEIVLGRVWTADPIRTLCTTFIQNNNR
jgi:putative transposase